MRQAMSLVTLPLLGRAWPSNDSITTGTRQVCMCVCGGGGVIGHRAYP